MTHSVSMQNEEREGTPEDFDFNDYFSLRRPRDAVAGFSSGLKSVVKGVAGGALSLVAAPVVYTQQEGVKGLGKGVAVGVTGAAVLPVVGVAVGMSQLARGIYNTPTAMYERSRGRYWDASQREWVDEPPQPLVVQEEEIPGSSNRSEIFKVLLVEFCRFRWRGSVGLLRDFGIGSELYVGGNQETIFLVGTEVSPRQESG